MLTANGGVVLKTITPEKSGVSSAKIQEYIEYLEENHISTHSIIMMRGDDIFFENYWKPFNADFKHRMYSVSKSLVGLAVGFLEQDGLIDLDKEIQEYFPKECKAQKDENMRRQTVRDMLMMSTAKQDRYWFSDKPADRVQYYFEHLGSESRPGGLFFRYDSTGSFVLGALVERIVGKPFMEYLRDKMFREIGVSDGAYCLKSPGGHSWGDSAVICTPRDMLKIARFTMNGGSWNGKQLLNRDYVTTATSKLIDNDYLNEGLSNNMGYGYLIWRTLDNSFFFNGMGSQLAICVPDKDIIMMYNADTQGSDPTAREMIIQGFFRMIVRPAADEALPEDAVAHKALLDYAESLELFSAKGRKVSPLAEKIHGVTYAMGDNPMGISKVRFDFTDEGGVLSYVNAQGDKQLPFGLCANVFGEFPQDGYADEMACVPGNRRYACAASAAWVDNTKLHLKVQIIDKYFGVLDAVFAFKGDCCSIVMNKTAEDFLSEYQGMATGFAVK